jgi:hypothetical protein
VPVCQHDFGCCDGLIGGVPDSLEERPGSTPLESLLFSRQPSRA